MRVREALEQMATSGLRRMAAVHGLPADDSTTRGELVERLAERLADHASVRAQLGSLPEPQRRALRAAQPSGEVRGFLLSRVLGSDSPDAARPLLERGFLVRTFAPLGPHRGEVYAVPDEILACLGDDPAEGSQTPGGPPPTPPPPRDAWRHSDPAFSLFALAAFLQRHPDAGAGDAGTLTAALRREVGAWSQEPGGWDWQDRWTFLQRVGTRASLFERRPDGTLGVARRAPELLSDRPRLALRLWQGYLRDRDWPDLERAGVPHADVLGEQVDPPALRAAVLGGLRPLPASTWVTLEALSSWMAAALPTFLREQLDARSTGLVDPASGQPLWSDGAWARVEAPLLRYLLLGPLYWLGVVVADAAGERVAVTAGGAALLGGQEPPSRRAAEPCAWEDDMVLVAPARADLGLLLRAERYLTLDARGAPSRYRLQRERVATATAAGGSIQECRELLARLSGVAPAQRAEQAGQAEPARAEEQTTPPAASEPHAPTEGAGPTGQAHQPGLPEPAERLERSVLPGAVLACLADWETRAGAVQLRPAVLLEARAPADLDALEAAPAIAPFLRRRLGPTAAVVAASAVPDLVDTLRAQGHLPDVDAALRLLAGRRAYAGLVDQRALEFLLLSLLAFQRIRPEQLAQLEGSLDLLERLEELFPPERLAEIRHHASELAAALVGPAPDDPLAVSPRPARGTRRSRSRRARR